MRVVTTGGGGWGDPLDREPDRVLRDVIEGKVSPAAARDDYGVALVEHAGSFDIDAVATAALRETMKAARLHPPSDDRSRRRI